jgi:hypothetical protein
MKKECNVIILPKGKKAGTIGLFRDTKNLVHNIRGKDIPRGDIYELYITSDEEIKEGDWVLNTLHKNECIHQIENNKSSVDYHTQRKQYKKIIATTDTLGIAPFGGQDILEVPQIPQSFIDTFIEEYNKGNVIDKVLVEYETKTYADVTNKNIEIDEDIKIDYKFNIIPKINLNNTINISLIEEEKKYSRKDIIEMLIECDSEGGLRWEEVDDWFNEQENLK